jgi:hypothetical protein
MPGDFPHEVGRRARRELEVRSREPAESPVFAKSAVNALLSYKLPFDDVDGSGFLFADNVRIFTTQPAIYNTCKCRAH